MTTRRKPWLERFAAEVKNAVVAEDHREGDIRRVNTVEFAAQVAQGMLCLNQFCMANFFRINRTLRRAALSVVRVCHETR
jgi:hypothetical protein